MGNFAYIEQIPELYTDFCKANTENDVFEFIEEQFIEFEFAESQAADEPFEKRAKPVPFQTPSMQTFTAFVEPINAEFIHTEETKRHNFTFILKEYWVHASSVFQPPENNLAYPFL
jgi:hypothetical protein